jgi:hypothetical protein
VTFPRSRSYGCAITFQRAIPRVSEEAVQTVEDDTASAIGSADAAVDDQ